MARVISGFPGVGKSWVAQHHNASDSDSSQFSWANAEKKVRHPEWPANYMDHIARKLAEDQDVLVSTHKEVRDALVAAGIEFTLVYPAPEMKAEYLERYKVRGSAPAFVALLEKNYEAWIAELQAQEHCTHLVLSSGQHLADVL